MQFLFNCAVVTHHPGNNLIAVQSIMILDLWNLLEGPTKIYGDIISESTVCVINCEFFESIINSFCIIN